MKYVGGWGGDPATDLELQMPAVMFNTGMLVVQTPNQCNCFEGPKAPQVVRSPRFNQMYAGDAVNDGGWM